MTRFGPMASRSKADPAAAAPAAPGSDSRVGAPERPARTVEELIARNVAAIQRLETAASAHRSAVDLFADRVARFAGSALFLGVHVIWFTLWILLNAVPGLPHFDPYPFTFLILVVSLEAIFLSAFILIAQNRAAVLSERRNQLDLQINLLTEQENTRMLQVLSAVAAQLGVTVSADPSAEVLAQATRPEALAEQIERAAKDDAPGGKRPAPPA